MPLMFLLYALFAFLFPVGKVTVTYGSPLAIVSTRMILSGCLMLLYVFFFQKGAWRSLTLKNLIKIALLGFFAIYLTNVLEYWGLQYLSAGKACLIYSISPFASSLLSYLYFSEKMTPQKWLGMFIGILGMLPIFLSGAPSEDMAGHLLFFSWAELAVLVAAVSAVYGWVLMRFLVRDGGCSSMLVNGLSMLWGGLLALGHSHFNGALYSQDFIMEWKPFVACIIAMIVISNFLCYNLYGLLLRKYTATLMQFAGFSTPLFAALFSWLWLGETVSWHFWLTIVFVFSGLFIFYREESRQGYIVSEG